MEVQFREMSEIEFKIFFENSINDYANDLIKSTVATMEEAFAEAKREFAESIIYVWKNNSPGINLYTKCGYVAFRELDEGMYMKKRIKG